MKAQEQAQAQRNRRTAVLTLAGIGFFHLVAFGVVGLLMSAGGGAADREVPRRPPFPLRGLAPSASPAADPPVVAAERLDDLWTARHKDASGPWSIDADGRVTWR